MSFGQLAAELEQLTKERTDPAAGSGEGNGNGGEGGEPLLKSFSFTLEDGTEVDAADATELLKSIVQKQAAQEGELLKVLTGMTTLVKSLQADMALLKGTGPGRRSVGQAPAAPAAPAAPKAEELMAKCLSAQAAGKLNGLDVSVAEQCLNLGQELPAHIAQRLV